MLAAEYVLGTLRGRARLRFERLIRDNPEFLLEVRYWERRLAVLGLRLPPQTPPPLVWTKIDRRINASRTASIYSAPRRVNVWRAFALAASLATVGLGFKLWEMTGVLPEVVQVPKIVAVQVPSGAPKEIVREVIKEVPVLQPMPYVAVLAPGGDLKYLLALSPGKGLIKVHVTGKKSPVDFSKRSLQLWVLDEGGKPHSLGVMPDSGSAEVKMPPGTPMPKSPTLAISDEPRGGSTTGLPTGPVLVAGPAIQAL